MENKNRKSPLKGGFERGIFMKIKCLYCGSIFEGNRGDSYCVVCWMAKQIIIIED